MRHLTGLLLATALVFEGQSALAQRALSLDEITIAPAPPLPAETPAPVTQPPSAPSEVPHGPAQPRPARSPRPVAGPVEWPSDIVALQRRTPPGSAAMAPKLCVEPGRGILSRAASSAYGLPARAITNAATAADCTVLAGSNEFVVRTMQQARLDPGAFAIATDTRTAGWNPSRPTPPTNGYAPAIPTTPPRGVPMQPYSEGYRPFYAPPSGYTAMPPRPAVPSPYQQHYAPTNQPSFVPQNWR